MQRSYNGIIFLGLCGLLAIIGCVCIYSASYVYAFELGLAPGYYLQKQLIGCMIAVITATAIAFAPHTTLRQWAPLLFIASLIATCLTFIPGIATTIHGARRWITVGAFSIQPGELLKVCTIWYLSYFLDKKTFTMRDFYHTFLPAIIIIACALGILIMQPDFGQAVTLGATCVILLYIFEMPSGYLIGISTFGAFISIMLILYAPYRLSRIVTFLDPWKDPQGSGFQIIQSLIAIGNGGIIGQGITNSQQKYFYLPMHHTDFIFSIWTEETGFFGAIAIITLFLCILYTGYRFALYFSSRLAQSFIIGYTMLITLQALTNISVTIGLLPTKGLGLPFISYGSSALVAHGIACGIIINCWKNAQTRKEFI